MNRTLVICKPDAVERGLVGQIIGRFERKGLRLVGAQLRYIDADLAAEHYGEHVGRPYFDALVKFITRSAAFVTVLEGPEETWRIVRSLIGATNPLEALPGTIRGDYGTVVTENLVHGSDGPESAKREIALFFPDIAAPRR